MALTAKLANSKPMGYREFTASAGMRIKYAASNAEWSVDLAANSFKNCPFAIRVSLKGKGAVLNLPGGRLIITAPYQNVTIGNSETDNPATPEYDPTRQVTLNVTGASHQITTSNGDVVTTATGRRSPARLQGWRPVYSDSCHCPMAGSNGWSGSGTS